jgi:hypothetical protein
LLRHILNFVSRVIPSIASRMFDTRKRDNKARNVVGLGEPMRRRLGWAQTGERDPRWLADSALLYLSRQKLSRTPPKNSPSSRLLRLACSLRCDYSAVPLAPRATDPATAPPPSSFWGNGTAPFALLGWVSLIFPPIPQPAVNDLPLIANHTEIEKVCPFIL